MVDGLKLNSVDPRHYLVDEQRRDGGPIRVRAIRSDDKQRLLDHFGRLSAEARYFRFFGHRSALTPQDLIYFTELDFVRHVGLAATISEGGEEQFIGVGRYIRREDPSRADVALAVLDRYQHSGIGSRLLQHLGRLANQAGITEFEADVMGDNSRMLELLKRSGCIIRHAYGAGIVHFSLRCPETFQASVENLAIERRSKAARTK
jgi:GNAT superfamily N-acetyltransferase